MIVNFGQAEFGVSVGTSGDGGQAAGRVDTSAVAVWSTALCVCGMEEGVRISATVSPIAYVSPYL